MASQYESGAQLAVISTEHTLNTTTPETSVGTFVLVIDTAAMLSGDTLEVRIKEKCRAGDTQRLAYIDTLGDVQAEPLWVSPAMVMLHGWDCTIKQTAGTGRTYPWSIREA